MPNLPHHASKISPYVQPNVQHPHTRPHYNCHKHHYKGSLQRTQCPTAPYKFTIKLVLISLPLRSGGRFRGGIFYCRQHFFCAAAASAENNFHKQSKPYRAKIFRAATKKAAISRGDACVARKSEEWRHKKYLLPPPQNAATSVEMMQFLSL